MYSKSKCLILVLSIYFNSCKNNSKQDDLYYLINEDSSIMIDIKNFENVHSNFEKSNLNKILKNTDYINNLEFYSHLNEIEPVNKKRLISILNFSGLGKYDWINAFYNEKILPKKDIEVFYKYQNTTIYKLNFKTDTYYISYKNDITFFSKNKLLIEDAIRQLEKKEGSFLKNIEYSTVKNDFNNKSINFFINLESFQGLLDSEFEKKINIKNTCKWIFCDISLKENEILLSGIVNENEKNFLNVLKKQSKNQISLDQYLPSNTSWFYFQNISDFYNYKKDYDYFLEANNQKGYSTKTIIQQREFLNRDEVTSFFNNEMVVVSQNEKYEIAERQKGLSLIIKIKNKEELIKKIKPFSTNYTHNYKKFTINMINETFDFKESFGNIAKEIKSPFYTIYQDIIIFSNYERNIKEIILDITEKKTLSESSKYQKFKSNFKNYNAFLFISNLFLANANINKIITPKGYISNYLQKTKDAIFDLSFMGLEFVSYNSNIIVSGILSYDNGDDISIRTNNVWTTEVKNKVKGSQVLLKNHRTKTLEYFFQDINNDINLISSKGNLVWSRSIKEEILGTPKQVDILNNGKLQTLFATNKKIYLIDIFGKDVDGFPVNIKEEITKPINIFDYEMNKNYRFAVVCGKQIFLYDKNGKKINGFKYNSLFNITSSINHIKVKSKDYLYFTDDNGKLKMLNRQGKDRLVYTPNYNLSEKGNISFMSNKSNYLSGFDKNEKMIHFYLDGTYKIFEKTIFENIKYYKITDNYELVYYNDYIYFMRNDIFYTYKKAQNIDIIGTINYKKNDYVYVVDKERESVFIINEKGVLESGFPIYGNTDIVIGDLLNNKEYKIISANGKHIYCFNL